MKERYGDVRKRLWGGEANNPSQKESIWWRDIIELSEDLNGATSKIRAKLGDGKQILFWKHDWLGGSTLATAFPNLYEQVMSKEFEVYKVGDWIAGDWFWNLRQGEKVFGREALEEFNELMVLLTGIRPTVNNQDLFIWPYENHRCYTVRSCYEIMNDNRNTEMLDAGVMEGLNSIWRAYVPSKLKMFGWRMLRDKLPSRKQLLKRHIIHQLNESLCVFCQEQEEDINHVILHCSKVEWLWRKVSAWLEIQKPDEEACWNHLLSCEEALKGKIGRERGATIWLTSCWAYGSIRMISCLMGLFWTWNKFSFLFYDTHGGG
ncbi:uncharacterized protein LOC131644827 [Vicia villosa]|uniref:uncharacterized protein LOC131644827 n=1 Tax=Vicia villosa TaxID=3911 RepID=UPI00273ADF48|nr:uncharacterized protein LOC131644827 [Vicia villosa]